MQTQEKNVEKASGVIRIPLALKPAIEKAVVHYKTECQAVQDEALRKELPRIVSEAAAMIDSSSVA